MLVQIELNVALARINPLFYKQQRVRISSTIKDSLTVKYSTTAQGVHYLDPINGRPLKSDIV
jgi:hypothetical protein